MAHLQINYDSSYGGIFVPGQLFVFGSMVFCADSAGHLAPVENYAPDHVVTFGSLEYTTDSHGELVLLGWTPDQIEGLSDNGGSTPEPISLEDVGPSPLAPQGPAEESITPASGDWVFPSRGPAAMTAASTHG